MPGQVRSLFDPTPTPVETTTRLFYPLDTCAFIVQRYRNLSEYVDITPELFAQYLDKLAKDHLEECFWQDDCFAVISNSGASSDGNTGFEVIASPAFHAGIQGVIDRSFIYFDFSAGVSDIDTDSRSDVSDVSADEEIQVDQTSEATNIHTTENHRTDSQLSDRITPFFPLPTPRIETPEEMAARLLAELEADSFSLGRAAI